MPIFDPAALNPGVRRREVLSWAGYDFANSGYTTVVLTAVFSAYFVSVVANGADWGARVWIVVLCVSNAAVMVTMPIIGAYADLHARKQRLLRLSTIGCVLSTAALALAGRGDVVIAVLAIAVSNFFFQIGVSLIGAFLPEIARPHALGKVSGWGWSFGYLGGLATLAGLPRLCVLGEGAGQGRRTLRSGDDVDYCRNFRAGLTANSVHS